ncbi:MAG: glycoside hydrolase family 3 N-terminal domain-containing protein [Longibaculum sp.]
MPDNYDQQIEKIISKMTLSEKVGQLNQHLYGWQCFEKNDNGDYVLTDIFKNHIQRFGGVGAIYGILRADPWSGMNEVTGVSQEDSHKVIDMIQDYIKENTRLKIPALISEECVHGHQGLHSMMYPSNISMGMTWNPELLQEICQEISYELLKKGGNLALYAAFDIMRDPRWGRSEECFSEDPYLVSQMTKAAVKGFQNQSQNKVGVVLKHLCAQGAAEGGHNSGAANIGPRELREIYLPQVKAGVEAGAKAVMAAYNEIDGIPCHINKELLTDILRNEYGFDGIVMSDGCALDRLLMLDPRPEKMAAKAIKAGVDLSLWDDIYTHLEESVRSGYLLEEELDVSVKRVLKLKFELGLFDDQQKPITYQSQKETLALQAAKESQVLLKNNGILPLSHDIQSIAVIGPNANQAMNMLGDYTSFQKQEDMITLYEGIQKVVSPQTQVKYALGCQIRSQSKDYLEEAIELAKNSDVVILALGGSSARNFKMEFESNGAVKTSYDKDEMNCGENVDKASLELDGIQLQLLEEIKKVNPHIVTVLIQGRPHTLNEVSRDSQAVLASWYPGNLGGLAIAQTLFGMNNPSGHLSLSIPYSSMQLPCFYNGKHSGAKEDYIDMPGKPLYPFGYGLSYTSFDYQNVELSTDIISKENLLKDGIDVSLDIYNRGEYDGSDVVQVYIIDNESSITRREKELKQFQKVFVKKHQHKKIHIHLDGESFQIWDYQMNHVIEEGTVQILIAKDSQDYYSKTITIL